MDAPEVGGNVMHDLLWVDLVRAKEDVDVVILPRQSLVLRPAVLFVTILLNLEKKSRS